MRRSKLLRAQIDKILLGDNPFIGVDHLSQERSREKGNLDKKKIAVIIRTALESGAQGLVCSAHPNIEMALNFMKEENYSGSFGVYLILPYAQSYVRLASEKGMMGLLNETFGKLSMKGKAKALVGGGLSALRSDPLKMMKTYLEAELSLFSKVLPKYAKLKSVFLHEILTELIISFELKDLAKEYFDFVKDSLGIMPGFVTRNFPRFVDFAEKVRFDMSDVVIMTPFNKIGFQMNPSKESCEKKLSAYPYLNVIAMSVMAAGYTNISDAIAYLSQWGTNVSCVVGVSTKEHARETFSKLKSVLYADYDRAISP